MPLCQSGLDELVRSMPGIGLVWAAINLYGNISLVQSHPQHCAAIILAEGECD